MAERLVQPDPYVLCALRTLCVCAVHITLFLSPLPPWLLWLVWLRVRPPCREWHVGLPGRAPRRLAQDGVVRRPPGAGLAGRPGCDGAAARLSTLWEQEAAAWDPRGRAAALRSSGSDSGLNSACGQQEAGVTSLQPGPLSGPGGTAGGPEAAGVWAWLSGRRVAGKRGLATTPGSRSSGNLMARTRGPVEMCMQGGLMAERGPSLRTPVASPEEVSTGRSCADPLWSGLRSFFAGLGWAVLSLVSLLRVAL